MNEVLLRKLIEKNHFRVGSEVDATYRGASIDGQYVRVNEQTFTITGIFETRKTKRILLDAHCNVVGATIRISVDHINRLDGMSPERFAANFLIDPDGNELKPSGKRRGRRPKGWAEEAFDVSEATDDDDDDDFFEC